MIRVAVTGSLASGKSTVGRLFERWGAWRIDADELARRAVAPGTERLARIREQWGERVLDAEGALDREAMRRLAFADPRVRERLEEIVHAGVRRLREKRLAEAEAAGAEIVVEEIPLLFEVGMEDLFDAVVTVDAPLALRRRRAAESRGWGPEAFDAVEAAQLPAAEKRARADFVIVNDGTRAELEAAAREVWERLLDASHG